MEFQGMAKIEQIGKLYMSITQKLHGTNAQVYIYKDCDGVTHIKAGCRTRYITPDNDNYGFAKFVEKNKEELIGSLGEGRHFGEWCGPGINAGEGLKEKQFYLFEWQKFKEKELPDCLFVVPVLYVGAFSFEAIKETMEQLKERGSRIVPGYMKPEGIVIQVGTQRFKKTFSNEEVKWQSEKKIRVPIEYPDVSRLLQPLRLEKLLSKDEAYIRNYPSSLRDIVKAYTQDLLEEKQITGTEEEVELLKKALGKNVFTFVKEEISAKYQL